MEFCDVGATPMGDVYCPLKVNRPRYVIAGQVGTACACILRRT
jgi:hypothetical protein